MKHLDKVLELVDNELKSVTENGKFRSKEEVDTVYKLIDVAKDIYCIWAYEDELDDGYSEAYGGYPMRYNVAYDGHSYARGRGRNAKRDSMGRYSRDDGGSYYGGRRSMNYSRDDGKQEYIDNLREMMHSAPDEQTRQGIERMIQQMGG